MADNEARTRSEARTKLAAQLTPPARVHFVGISGTAMASAATLLKEQGFQISGSDRAFYPPMGEVVRALTDQVYESYATENLEPAPDLVVIGNAVGASNPEAQYVEQRPLPYVSLPELLRARLIKERDEVATSVVVAGTHGKTTTTTAIAHILEQAGKNPGYLIGGMPKNLPSSIKAATNDVVVLEGDEYDSAYFAKWPKFLSYRPDVLILTNLEFDHADIYSSLADIKREFIAVANLVPKEGLILYCADDKNLRELFETTSFDAKTLAYGFSNVAILRVSAKVSDSNQKLSCTLINGTLTATTSMLGKHNAQNLLVAAACAEYLSVHSSVIESAIESFRGVRRRQEQLVNSEEVLLIEDFAHHPSAVKTTLAGLKAAYPKRRLVAVFEPRSNTSRQQFFQDAYVASLGIANAAYLKTVSDTAIYSATKQQVELLDVPQVVAELRSQGIIAECYSETDALFSAITEGHQPGDVVVVMSNGSFDGLAGRLRERWA